MSLIDSVTISVQDHAVYQFALRFRSESPTSQRALPLLRQTIVAEVREGFREGRFSARKPPGLHPPDDPNSLYVWDVTGKRVYAVWHSENPPMFVVMTTMKVEDGAQEAAEATR